jgi:methyl-accepting chemotaxis protein
VARPLGGEPAAATDLANRIAAGDLEVEIAVPPGDTRSLMAAMSRMQHGLAGIVGRIHRTAESITVGAGQIATGNADLSRRTDGQAASLEQTASSMEQITVTVKRNAENAKQADGLAAEASAVAVRGREAVAHVVATMTSINASSRKIEDIISVIEGIAFQTNILALNAAVEAARAGKEGRGFAVVAAEVRMLAQRSSAAAKDIKRLIADSVEKVVDGTKQVDDAGKTMDEIVSAVKGVNLIMAEIATASQEQSLGIGQVNQAVREMEVITQQNAALVQEATAAAESLQAQSNDLVNAASEFRLARADGGARRKYGGADGPRDVLLMPAAAGVPAAI